MRNTGQESQERFEAYWNSLGKAAFLERRIDLAHVRGLNPGIRGIRFPAQPSDYILTFGSLTYYCEVKSCSNKTSFPFSQIEKGQWAAMMRVTAAGGEYLFYLHKLETDDWYRVPAKLILAADKEGKASIRWDQLKGYEAQIP